MSISLDLAGGIPPGSPWATLASGFAFDSSPVSAPVVRNRPISHTLAAYVLIPLLLIQSLPTVPRAAGLLGGEACVRSGREGFDAEATERAAFVDVRVGRHNHVAPCNERRGHMNCVRHLEHSMSSKLDGFRQYLVGHINEDDAALGEEVLEPLPQDLVAGTFRSHETLRACQLRSHDHACWSGLGAANDAHNGSSDLGRSLDSAHEETRIEADVQSGHELRSSRNCRSISSPDRLPGGSDSRYSATDRRAFMGWPIWTRTSTLITCEGSGASRRSDPSSMCAGIVTISIIYSCVNGDLTPKTTPFPHPPG